MTLENNQRLIQGAEILGAGRTLGLTDDEAIQVANAAQTRQQKMDERRRQQRAARANRNRDLTPEEQQILDTANKDMELIPRGRLAAETDFEDTESDRVFGEDQSDFQNTVEEDKDFRRGQRNDNLITYTDPVTKEVKQIEIPEGVPTRSMDVADTWQERQAIRSAGHSAGFAVRNERDTGGGRTAAQSAFKRLEQQVLDGKISLDDVITNDLGEQRTVRQLLARLQEQDGGRAKARDKRRGRKAAIEDSRIISGNLTEAEKNKRAQELLRREYEARENSIIQPGGELPSGRITQSTGALPAPITPAEARALVDAQLEGQPARYLQQGVQVGLDADARAGQMIDEAGGIGRLRKQAAILDSLPDISPGGTVYITDQGFAAPSAQDIDAGVDYMPTNARNMKRIKLTDYAFVDPQNPANWDGSNFPMAESTIYGDAGLHEYTDRYGTPLGDVNMDVATVNTPDSRQALNIPANPVTVQDLAAAEISKRQKAERMRQVDIGGSIGTLMERLQATAGGKAGAFANQQQPRSLEELQGLVDAVVSEGRRSGRNFYAVDPATPGRSKKTSNPTARDVLQNTLRMSPDEVGNLAQALTMLDAARDTQMPVDASRMAQMNHQFKEDYYAGLNDGATPGARPGANTVGGVTRVIPDPKSIYSPSPYASGDPARLGGNMMSHIDMMGSKDRVAVGTKADGTPIKKEVGPLLRQLTGEGISDPRASKQDVVDFVLGGGAVNPNIDGEDVINLLAGKDVGREMDAGERARIRKMAQSKEQGVSVVTTVLPQ